MTTKDVSARRSLSERFLFFLILGFGSCTTLMFCCWNRSLMDFHFFRQTQTAISTYYFLKDGFTLDYATPVLGPPWSLPFEFPLYQFITAILVKITHLPLDQAGRTVSLFFWIACLAPLHGLLKLWKVEHQWRWISLLIVWSAPTYLFWSHCFLIESLSLFLALAYFYSALQMIRNFSPAWCALMIIFGTLAAVQKATTFLIVMVPLSTFALLELWPHYRQKKFGPIEVSFAFGVVIPFIFLFVWTAHADHIKAENSLGQHFLTSTALKDWNFGTWNQRLDSHTWRNAFIAHTTATPMLITLIQLIIIIAGLFHAPLFRKEIFLLFLGYLTGPLLFYNLFYIHDYYSYENQIYLILAFSLSLYALTEKSDEPRRSQIRYGIASAVILAGLFFYLFDIIPSLAITPSKRVVQHELQPLTQAGKPEDILVIYGLDWNPCIAYYSERKAIMPVASCENDSLFQSRISDLSSRGQIAAMVVAGKFAENKTFISEQVKNLNLNPRPIESNLLKNEGSKLIFYLKK